MFCYNNMTALGTMHQIRRRGLTIPEQPSVAGFDDLYLCQYLQPRLTAVRQPTHKMGRMTMETLLHIFDGPCATYNLRSKGQLIIRESTAMASEDS